MSGSARALRHGHLVPLALISVGAVLTIALVLAFAIVLTRERVSNELALPVLAILGVVCLLTTLAFAAISFSRVGMGDSTQALGLPPGSVRAAIALSLIVLFAILTVYLFSSLASNGQLMHQRCLRADEKNNFLAKLKNAEILSDAPMTRSDIATECLLTPPSPTGNAAAPPSPAGNAGAPRSPTGNAAAPPSLAGNAASQPLYYEVVYRSVTNPTGDDFAKQLLVLIGTLVTSVASFYFGSKAVSEASAVISGMPGAPTLTGIDPPKLGPGPHRLAILGTNLNSIKQVQLTQGDRQVTATNVTSNDNRVDAQILIPEATPDPWDIVVSDATGRSARLPGALRIVQPQPTDAPKSDDSAAEAPTLTGIDPPKLGPGPQRLTVLGTNLNSIKQVQLTQGDRQVTATNVTSNDNRVDAQILIPEATPDPWDIVVSDATGRSARLPGALRIVQPQPTDAPKSDDSPAKQAQLRSVADQLDAERQNLIALNQAAAGAPVVTDAPALIDSISKVLDGIKPLLTGHPGTSDMGAAIDTASAALQTAQNSGLPGVLADAVAVLKGVGTVAAPAIAGIPGGPVGIAAGVVFGILQLAQEQQKVATLKAALLKAPFDPTLVPIVPDAVTALAALQGSPLTAACLRDTRDQAVATALMQAAIAKDENGTLLPGELVVARLLKEEPVVSALSPTITPAALAQALDQYRGTLIFNEAQKRLDTTIQLPAIRTASGGSLKLSDLAEAVQSLRTDPRGAAAIERLITAAETLARLPGGVQAHVDLASRAFGVALDLASSKRSSTEPAV